MCYRISSRNGIRRAARGLDATHMVSLVDPGTPLPPRPSRVRAENHRLFRLHDLDTTDPLAGGPTRELVDELVALALALPDDARVLVHCEAGRRRSAAAALTMVLARALRRASDAAITPGDAASLVATEWERMLAVRPQACPNPAMLVLADARLGLDGALSARAELETPAPLHPTEPAGTQI